MNKQTEALKMAREYIERNGATLERGVVLTNIIVALEHKTRIWECEGYDSLCQQLEIAEKKIERLKAQKTAQWISVKDRFPRERDDVICTDGKTICLGYTRIWNEGKFFVTPNFGIEPTHWMPLPEALKELK